MRVGVLLTAAMFLVLAGILFCVPVFEVSTRVEQEVVGIYAEARNIGMQAAAAGLGGVSLLAFVLTFKLKRPTPEEGIGPSSGLAANA